MKMSIRYQESEISYNCNTHSDNDNRHYQCDPYEHENETAKRCISIDHICNGLHDCPNGDDEVNCPFTGPTTDNTQLQGAVTYYALMATLCTVMIILILVAFFVHRFRKIRCDSAFRGVNFAPLIYRPVGATFAHAACQNSVSGARSFGSSSSLRTGYPGPINRERDSRSLSHCCIATNSNNLAFDRVFNPMSLSNSSSRFFVNYNVHNNCMRIVQSSRSTCSVPSTPIAPPSYLETMLDPTYHRRSTRMPSVPDESEVDAPPYEPAEESNGEDSSTNVRNTSIVSQNSPPPPYSET